MSDKSRVNRPTYATASKPCAGRMIHVSTDYCWVPVPNSTTSQFMRIGKGTTFTRK